MSLVPVHDFGGLLSDDELGSFLRKGLGGGGKGVTKTKAANQDYRLACGSRGCAAEVGELFLRAMREGSHQLFAPRLEVKVAIVTDEGKGFTFGGGGFGEDNLWFQDCVTEEGGNWSGSGGKRKMIR